MIDPERILITGGSGMVGSQVPWGITPSHAECDITDEASIASTLEKYQPSAILHFAGLIDVKRCEEQPEEAMRINGDGARLMANAAMAADIPLVYMSSCMVFDGEKQTPYNEDDVPHPLTVYGKTKVAGEAAALAAPGALVIRTGWLFGGFERDIKFVKRFHDMLVAGTAVRATSDRFGSPTFVPDLITETLRLVQQGEHGVRHVVNSGIASYYDVARVLKHLTGSTAEVMAVTQHELNASEAPRGSMEGLVSACGVSLRPYEEALATYVAALAARS